ncbi:MAG: hypothetical protein ISS56_01790 [Anaerolineae bacterium]|nr:hypothetical protein [Anaerolineae bacterium]
MNWEQPPTQETTRSARSAQAGTVIFMALTVLVLLCYLMIFANPQVAFNPFRPPFFVLPTATPVVRVPTATLTPSMTPTYPSIWTPTATVPPTETSEPGPLSTARPPRPTRPPTATPKTLPRFTLYQEPVFVQQLLYRDANTSDWWSGVAGEVADRNGRPVTDVTIRVRDNDNNEWTTKPGDAVAYSDRYSTIYGGRGTYAWWEQVLKDSCHRSVGVHVQVFENDKPVTAEVSVQTTGDCKKNLILIHFQKNY